MSDKTTEGFAPGGSATADRFAFLPKTSLGDLVATYGLYLFAGVTIAFLWLPLLFIVVLSFGVNSSSLVPFEGFTLANYVDLFTNASLMSASFQSFVVATTSAVVATALGVPAAFALARYSFRGKEAFRSLVILPLLIPGVIMGIDMLIFFQSVIDLPLGFFTTVATHSVFGLPFIVLPVAARLLTFDRSIEESARDLGADPLTVMRDVTLPVVAPAVAAGFVFAWLRSFEDFTRAFFVSGTMDLLTKSMYSLVVYGQNANVMKPMATVLIVLVGVALLVAMNIGQVSKYV
ncbi:ABC transporter permease [Candidatus Halobonum tyrrellensis]|uniref:Spermidine/putrescine ABC transporter permease ii n=1 Tax=Candidatus Halobonum tyrrellensis G22 TaxID=1324957 RepID=V4HQG9_9EURY|nr:ABC transporter permease [Candidatus Halobonum tyrrellensis]ESP90164.1 spermidine/putrescine ABC transporter permease ii [Candidatus Halobonum tyrrellensis G22]